MCPADSSHLTLEFADHFVITPSIQFVGNTNFARNSLGEEGVSAKDGFEYSSGTNPHFLSVEEIAKMNINSGIK